MFHIAWAPLSLANGPITACFSSSALSCSTRLDSQHSWNWNIQLIRRMRPSYNTSFQATWYSQVLETSMSMFRSTHLRQRIVFKTAVRVYSAFQRHFPDHPDDIENFPNAILLRNVSFKNTFDSLKSISPTVCFQSCDETKDCLAASFRMSESGEENCFFKSGTIVDE